MSRWWLFAAAVLAEAAGLTLLFAVHFHGPWAWVGVLSLGCGAAAGGILAAERVVIGLADLISRSR